MSERTGTCEQCGQRFGGIPDTVTATKVKCRECGGTVAIPPLAVDSPAEAPAAAAPEAPAKEAAEKPLAQPLGESKPKKERRPEKAKPVDREVAKPAKKATAAPKPPAPVRKPAAPIKPIVPVKPVAKPAKPVVPVKKPAPPAAPVPPKPKAPAPPPKPRSPKPAAAPAPPKAKAPEAPAKQSAADIIAKAKAKRTTQEAQPAAAKAETKTSAADIIAKAKAKREAGGGEGKAAPKKVTAKPGLPKVGNASRPKTAGSRRRPAAGGVSARGGSSSRSRRREQEEEEYEEKSKAPMVIGGVVVLALLGGGSWWMFGRGGDEAATETVNVPADAETSGSSNQQPASSDQGQAQPASSTPETSAGQPTPATEGLASNEGTTPEAAPAPKPKPPVASGEWAQPEPGDPVSTVGITQYELILLEQVPPLPRFQGTSDAIWAEVVEDLELFLDDGGASSNRAGNRLVEDYPRDAYPAIVNAMMQLDFSTQDGLRMASFLNDLMLRIGTKDLGWKQAEFLDPGTDEWNTAVTYNKKVVAGWQRLWVNTLQTSASSWNTFAKVAIAADTPAGDSSGGIVGPEEDPFD